MSPTFLFTLLRFLVVFLLYSFLIALLWMLWRDIRAATRATLARTQRIGQLVVLESGLPEILPGAIFPLIIITSLGRAPTNAIPLPDDTASLEHALLHWRDGRWWLEDLESRNGTVLNGVLITQATPVMAGDVIGIGRVKLKLEAN